MNKNGPDDPSASGEFTRLFRDLDAPEPKPAVTPNPPAATPAPPEQAVTKPMTRLFSAKAQPQRPERASNVAPLESKPAAGEFTQLFQPAKPEQPLPAADRSPQRPAQAGEFTRMFSVPSLDRAEPPSTDGSFTQMFNSPQFPAAEKEVNWKGLDANPAPPANKPPGEFTSMFERSKLPVGEPPARPQEDIFPSPPARSFDTEVHSDDFERIISQARRPSAEQAPPVGSTPAPSEQPAKKQPRIWLLVILIGVVLLLATGAIYLFVIRG